MKNLILWAIFIVSATCVASCTNPETGRESEQQKSQIAGANIEIISPAFVLFYTEN